MLSQVEKTRRNVTDWLLTAGTVAGLAAFSEPVRRGFSTAGTAINNNAVKAWEWWKRLSRP